MSGVRPGKAKGPWVGKNPALDLDIKVAASGTDTTPDFLLPKLAAGSNIALNLLNPGGNEQVEVSVNDEPEFAIVYLADENTDGTWRMRQVGADLIFERREGGVYIQKGAMTP